MDDLKVWSSLEKKDPSNSSVIDDAPNNIGGERGTHGEILVPRVLLELYTYLGWLRRVEIGLEDKIKMDRMDKKNLRFVFR